MTGPIDTPGRRKPNARMTGYTFGCQECGAVFRARRCTAYLCSARCRQAASRRVRAACRAAAPVAASLARAEDLRRAALARLERDD